jgi:hypothetical protein
MDKKQALEVIKQILDAASKSGLFQNLESSMTAANAFQVITAEINKNENAGSE